MTGASCCPRQRRQARPERRSVTGLNRTFVVPGPAFPSVPPQPVTRQRSARLASGPLSGCARTSQHLEISLAHPGFCP